MSRLESVLPTERFGTAATKATEVHSTVLNSGSRLTTGRSSGERVGRGFVLGGPFPKLPPLQGLGPFPRSLRRCLSDGSRTLPSNFSSFIRLLRLPEHADECCCSNALSRRLAEDSGAVFPYECLTPERRIGFWTWLSRRRRNVL